MKSMKRKFRIPPSYSFTTGCSNPSRIVSLASFVSSCSSPMIHQRTFRLMSTNSSSSSPSSCLESDVDDDEEEIFQTPPSSADSGVDSNDINPFEKLAKQQSIQVKQSSASSRSLKTQQTIADKSKISSNDQNSTVISDATVISTPTEGNIVVKGKHRLATDVERIVQEHLQYVREKISDGWDLIHQEGEMKVYRREVEENGIVVDPLKIFHTIKGVTGHEICRYFYEYQYRMEWETTLDSTKIIEVLDPETVVFYQVHKRVWPAAQRDSCFWSHIRCIAKSEEDQPTWLVVNYTTPHQLAPIKAPQVRLVANVAMICETIINEPPLNPKDIKRENIQCKLTYVAFVNPGGWVPSAALRSVAKREYPRFLKRFTAYVIEQTRDKPILF